VHEVVADPAELVADDQVLARLAEGVPHPRHLPGISIMFTRVPSMCSPCSTSGEVAMKVTSAPAGTRISAGLNDHACPTITTS
jgi:hypothetical protein